MEAHLDHGQRDLIGHLRTRIARSHKRGRKPLPKGGQVLSRTAEQLLRRIAKVTAEGGQHWTEENDVVAKALHVHRSTIVRTVRRFCQAGLLDPIETRGGRGHVSVYRLDFSLAQEALRSRRWPEARCSRLPEQAQEEGQEGAHPEKEAQRMPSFAGDVSRGDGPSPPAPHHPNRGDGASVWAPLFPGDEDRVSLKELIGRGGLPNDQVLSTGIGEWWERQPEGIRRGVKAAGVEGVLTLTGALLGGWRWAAIIALVGTPLAVAYAISPDRRLPEQTPAEPGNPMPRPVIAPPDQMDAIIGALAVCASSSHR